MFLLKKKIFQKILITKKTRIDKVQKIFNTSGIPICFILDKNKVIIGSITDGDLRRSKNTSFNTIGSLMNKNPLIVKENDDISSVEFIMKSIGTNYAPIINKKKEVIGVYSRNEYYSKNIFTNYVVFMVGGLGLRMRPLTSKTPKPMLKISGKPILEHLIEKFKRHGFKNFILVTHYKSKIIENYFGNGARLNIKIKYVKEKKMMGTAGGLGLLKKITKPFIVINGDVISDIDLYDFINFHNKNKSYATLVSKKIKNHNLYGVVKTSGKKIIDIKEKPIDYIYVNTGIYCFNKQVINFIKLLKIDQLNMNDLFMLLIKRKKKILNYTLDKEWTDIGNKKNYEKIKKKYKKKKIY